jgi:hypothetical protein
VTADLQAALCVSAVLDTEDLEAWRFGYDSLDSFYVAHEGRHPDIRVYAVVARELADVMTDASGTRAGIGALIAQRIALGRASTGIGS